MTSEIKRGKVYIFNRYTYFDSQENYIPRYGSEIDVLKLRNTFEAMKAAVEVFPDINIDELQKKMEEIRTKNFNGFDYVAIAFCSHGWEDNIAEISNKRIYLNETLMLPMIDNLTLAGKLKWLITQTCRGRLDLSTSGFHPAADRGIISRKKYCLTSFASTEGCAAYRNDKNGSIFIQKLCDTLMEYYQQEDIISILNRVRDSVIHYYKNQENRSTLQIPCNEDNFGTKFSFSFKKF